MTVTTDSEDRGHSGGVDEGTEDERREQSGGQSEAKTGVEARSQKSEGVTLSTLALGPSHVRGHRGRFLALDEGARFAAKVVETGGCWLRSSGHNAKGYATFRAAGGRLWRAHRWLWERTVVIDGRVIWCGGDVVRPIPEGLTLDHLCHEGAARLGLCPGGNGCPHRGCVDPRHLELVTRAENTSRVRRRSSTSPAPSATDGAHAVGRLLGPLPPGAGATDADGQPASGLGVRPAGLGPLQRAGDQGRLPPLTTPGAP